MKTKQPAFTQDQIEAWWTAFQDQPVTSAQLIELLNLPPCASSERGFRVHVGKMISNISGVTFPGDLAIVRCSEFQPTTGYVYSFWRLVQLTPAASRLIPVDSGPAAPLSLIIP